MRFSHFENELPPAVLEAPVTRRPERLRGQAFRDQISKLMKPQKKAQTKAQKKPIDTQEAYKNLWDGSLGQYQT